MSSQTWLELQDLPKGPGSYVLLLHLRDDLEIRVGCLGVLPFSAGYYLYVGSALGGLRGRVARHLRRAKRLRWHIDYVTERVPIIEIWWRQGPGRVECALAARLAALAGIVRSPAPIGASDCACYTHLFYSVRRPNASEMGMTSLLVRCGTQAKSR